MDAGARSRRRTSRARRSGGKFDIGDLATLFLLESRLVGRGEDLTFDEMFGSQPTVRSRPRSPHALKAKVNDPGRTMLGTEQEAWLAAGLKASVDAGKKWQVLGNQVTMAKVKMPDLQTGLPPEKYETGAGRQPSASGVDRTLWPAEWNLDSWSGFPSARERLYAAAKAAKAQAGDADRRHAHGLGQRAA